jgi:hypothetical protein
MAYITILDPVLISFSLSFDLKKYFISSDERAKATANPKIRAITVIMTAFKFIIERSSKNKADKKIMITYSLMTTGQ